MLCTAVGLQVQDFFYKNLSFLGHHFYNLNWNLSYSSGKVITAAYVPVVNYHNLFPGELF